MRDGEAGEVDRLARFMTRPGPDFGLAMAIYADAVLADEYRSQLVELVAAQGRRVGVIEFGVDDERIDLVAQGSRGFVYLVSLTGVTGTRESLPSELEGFVARVRQRTTQPLCVGFGISNPRQARRVGRVADGIIVGSRIVQLMEGEGDDFSSVKSFVEGLRAVL